MATNRVTFRIKSAENMKKPGFFSGIHPIAVISLPGLSDATYQTNRPESSDDDPQWNQAFILQVSASAMEEKSAEALVQVYGDSDLEWFCGEVRIPLFDQPASVYKDYDLITKEGEAYGHVTVAIDVGEGLEADVPALASDSRPDKQSTNNSSYNTDSGDASRINTDDADGSGYNRNSKQDSGYNADSGDGSGYKPASNEDSSYNTDSGDGTRFNTDSGDGSRYNTDSGEGSRYNTDSGDGSRYNTDSGDGSAYNKDSGDGSRYNKDSGDGSRYNTESGYDAGSGDRYNPDAGEGGRINSDVDGGSQYNTDSTFSSDDNTFGINKVSGVGGGFNNDNPESKYGSGDNTELGGGDSSSYGEGGRYKGESDYNESSY